MHHNKKIKYYFVENYIEGDYYKYNNNAGWTSQTHSTEFNQISQAFSHFTWQYSQGQLLVVDIQGAELGVLTDPQIHTKTRSRLYGQGDLGYEGMLKFFHTHHCNQYCERLQLIHPILHGSIPNNFNFFSQMYGLEQQEKKEDTAILENSEKIEEKQVQDNTEEQSEMSQSKAKKQKKKRGFALKAEYEKEQKKLEDMEKVIQQKKGEEEKSIVKPKETFVGTQCSLCKKCFFVRKQTIVDNKLNKLDTLCEGCDIKCQQSLLDLACTKCGSLFKISKYYCRAKKVNLIGQCNHCRD